MLSWHVSYDFFNPDSSLFSWALSRTSTSLVASASSQRPSRILLPEELHLVTAALQFDNPVEWQQVMQDEIEPLLKNNTWELVTLSYGWSTVKNKWIYKIRVKSDGTIDKFKAHLVAKRYSQLYGLDYDETYAPTTKADSTKTLLSIVATKDCEMVQLDIKTAFLYGGLDEEIYMDLPSGYDILNSKGKVCRLIKSLYGLYRFNQANRQWNKKFSDFLQWGDLQQSVADPCVFYSTMKPLLATTIFVDDGLGISTAPNKLQRLISYL